MPSGARLLGCPSPEWLVLNRSVTRPDPPLAKMVGPDHHPQWTASRCQMTEIRMDEVPVLV